MVPLRLEGSCLIIGVADDFVMEWVDNSFGPDITESLQDIAGHDYSYRFEPGHVPESTPESPEDVVEERAVEPVAAVPEMPAAEMIEEAPLRDVYPVNSNYTFENFVVGEENRYAYTAACRAAECPGLFNPLYIYGNTGIGKTHLLHAIVHQTRKTNPRLVVSRVEPLLG